MTICPHCGVDAGKEEEDVMMLWVALTAFAVGYISGYIHSEIEAKP